MTARIGRDAGEHVPAQRRPRLLGLDRHVVVRRLAAEGLPRAADLLELRPLDAPELPESCRPTDQLLRS